jgi:predicted ATPase/DNA-binding SARP family transcriptional activator
VATLSLALLGSFQAALDGTQLTGFESNKVRALLAYLAVEADRAHHREEVAELLWPERRSGVALHSLRNALSNLRQVLRDAPERPTPGANPPFLIVHGDTLQFNGQSDHCLDVAAFTASLAAAADQPAAHTIDRLSSGLALYQGRFLQGLSVRDSALFEEWVLLKRAEVDQLALDALQRLADIHEQRGEYEQAERYARRQLSLEPWAEEAHRQLMRLLALDGRRSAALAQYQACRALLRRELGVEPSPLTTQLYQAIRDGASLGTARVAHAIDLSRAPALQSETGTAPAKRQAFVGREAELARLHGELSTMLQGEGRVVLVIGEPGSGKTALIEEFASQALAANDELAVAAGQCNAQSGIGDPYLPFVEILQMLSGDMQGQLAGGSIDSDRARRLWSLVPRMAQILVDKGPDLVDLFVSAQALLERVHSYSLWSPDAVTAQSTQLKLQRLLDLRANRPGRPPAQQTGLFEQITQVLQELARSRPLVLVLDDLQWADAGTAALFFHLCRRLGGGRILVIAAFRPGDLATLRDGERHPLQAVIHELQRDRGDLQVDLSQANGRKFVRSLLDLEPNRLDSAFFETLYQHTAGHPLFTIELLRGLQERRDLVRDPSGYWVEGQPLDWQRLPARVEAVIAERIARLPAETQHMLAAASVQGESFHAEVVARTQGVHPDVLLQSLSGPLSSVHRLVRAQSVERVGSDGQVLSRFRFQHALYQKYLYGRLDAVQRAHLHERIGNALEALHERDEAALTVLAPQLARHFEVACRASKAAAYCLRAGNRSLQLGAATEALAHFQHGLALLEHLPDTPQRAQQELALQLALCAPLQAVGGRAAPERRQASARAYELCLQLGSPREQMIPVLHVLWSYHHLSAQHRKAKELAVQLLELAEEEADPLCLAQAHMALGQTLTCLGELKVALKHLEQAVSLYDPQQHTAFTLLTGQDVAVTSLGWASLTLWSLGYPDQGLRRGQQALALAEKLDHEYTLALAYLLGGGYLRLFRREVEPTEMHARALQSLAAERGFAIFEGWARILLGWVRAQRGDLAAGIAQIEQGLAGREGRAGAVQGTLPHQLGLLAEAQYMAGRHEQGLKHIAEALDQVARTGECNYQGELHRIKGELLEGTGADPEAEACLRQAIQLAEAQDAKSWQLRATVTLCRLMQRQGRNEEARQMLGEIYGWFSEGLETADLVEARVLLDELG